MIGPRIGSVIGLSPTVPTGTSLTIALADSTDPIVAGDSLSYTTTVTNTGSATAHQVVAIITLDAGLTYVSASGTGWTITRTGQIVRCSRAALAVGAAPDITVNVTAPTAGTVTTTATATSANSTGTAAPDSESTVVSEPASWTLDATSGYAVPQDEDEVNALLDDAGVVARGASLYLFGGPASGNVSDDIGARDLTAFGVLAYRQSVTGWASKSIKTVQGVDSGLRGVVANINAHAYTVFLLARTGTVLVEERTLMAFTPGNYNSSAAVEFTTAPHVQVGYYTARTVGAADPTNAVHPYVFCVDVNGADSSRLYTDQEKLEVTNASTPSGTSLLFGGDYADAWHPGITDYIYAFVVDAALTATEIKAVLESAGWAPPWSP